MSLAPSSGGPVTADVQPSRGVVLLDLSSFSKFSTTLPARMQVDPDTAASNDRRLWEVLLYLGRHGFDVVLPEIVAYKGSGLLSKNRSMREFFGENREKHVGLLRSLLQKGLRERTVRILPSAPFDVSEAGQFVIRLHDIFNDPRRTLASRRRAFTAVQAGYNTRFTNLAILQAVQHLAPVTNHLFVLTDNPALQEAAELSKERYRGLHLLNFAQFFDALIAQGVLSALGITANEGKDFLPVVKSFREEYGLNTYFDFTPARDPSQARAIFTGALRGIVERSLVEEKSEAPMPSSSLAGANRVTRFETRYGRFGNVFTKPTAHP